MHPARAILIGLLIGTLPALLIRSGIRVMAELSNRPVGVNLFPVVVAGRALPTGGLIKKDDFSQRSVPEEMVTKSIVKPDSASYVINQPLAVPLANGDPIPWHAFEALATIEGKRASQELIDACSAEMARRNVARAPASVAELRKSIEGTQP